MTSTGSQVGKLFCTQRSFPTKFRDYDRPGQHHLIAPLIAKWNGPASGFIEALDRINQVAKECVTAHLTVAKHCQSRSLLHFDGFINRLILKRFKFRVADLSLLMFFASFLQVGRAQQASDDIAWIHKASFYQRFSRSASWLRRR